MAFSAWLSLAAFTRPGGQNAQNVDSVLQNNSFLGGVNQQNVILVLRNSWNESKQGELFNPIGGVKVSYLKNPARRESGQRLAPLFWMVGNPEVGGGCAEE